jgi:hypothetical protein
VTALDDAYRPLLAELIPLVRRCSELDPATLVRVRASRGTATAISRLPFGALVTRAVPAPCDGEPIDATFGAGDLLDWLEDDQSAPPAGRDADWRGGLPPTTGWWRIESVPDEVVRGLVRTGALAVKDAARREGVPGAQPRADVLDAVLGSVVLTVTSDGVTVTDESGLGVPGADVMNGCVEQAGVADTVRVDASRADVTLRSLTALVRMGFLPRGSHVVVDVCGRWTRIAAAYGSVYAEQAAGGLDVIGR